MSKYIPKNTGYKINGVSIRSLLLPKGERYYWRAIYHIRKGKTVQEAYTLALTERLRTGRYYTKYHYKGIPLSEVAEKAGVAYQTVYYHYLHGGERGIAVFLARHNIKL